MFDKLLKLVTGAETPSPGAAVTDQRSAVAALLVEAARMDQQFGEEERATINSLLAARFELDSKEAARLVDAASERMSDTAHYFPFTHAINTSMSAEQKVEVIEMLWSVAYADGSLDPHEDQLIRQIAGLIHVTDRERMLARKRALGGA